MPVLRYLSLITWTEQSVSLVTHCVRNAKDPRLIIAIPVTQLMSTLTALRRTQCTVSVVVDLRNILTLPTQNAMTVQLIVRRAQALR